MIEKNNLQINLEDQINTYNNNNNKSIIGSIWNNLNLMKNNFTNKLISGFKTILTINVFVFC